MSEYENSTFFCFLNSVDFSDSSEKAQRIEIAKIHLPDGFTWKILNEQKIKDAAILELKTDAQFTPKVTQSEKG